MSIKKMSLLVSSFLVFVIVLSVVVNTVLITNYKKAEKNLLNIKHKIDPNNMVSSYNYVVIEQPKEEVQEIVDNVANNDVVEPSITEVNDAVYVGKMTGYGADCAGCSGTGNLSCKTADGTRHTLSTDGEYYYDNSYGSVRIVAASLQKFPCGTIVKIDHPILGSFYAVVMDTGGSVNNAWANGTVWMDLAFKTESDPLIYSSTSNNTTYSVQRWGW